MPKLILPSLLVFTFISGCSRSNREADLEQRLAEVEAKQKSAGAHLAEKERDLAAREEALKQGESAKLAEKERELSAREAELTKAEEAQAPSGAKAKPEAGPHEVEVTVQLNIDMTKPDGKAWDVGGGAPDPEITLQASSGASGSQRFKDTLTPAATFKAKLGAGDKVTISAVDKDAMANDPMGSFSTTYQGRAATNSGKLGAAKITVTFAN